MTQLGSKSVPGCQARFEDRPCALDRVPFFGSVKVRGLLGRYMQPTKRQGGKDRRRAKGLRTQLTALTRGAVAFLCHRKKTQPAARP